MQTRDWQASLSMVGGDGAVVRGGKDRAKPGTSAAEYLWMLAHPELQSCQDADLPLLGLEQSMSFRLADASRLWFSTEWDKMHREDKRITRAIAQCPLGEHFQISE